MAGGGTGRVASGGCFPKRGGDAVSPGASQTRPAMSGPPFEGGGDKPKLAPRFRPLAKFIRGSVAWDRPPLI